MSLVLVAIPSIAAVLALAVAHHDDRLRRVLIRIVVGVFVLALLVLVPSGWLPWSDLGALGLGQGTLGDVDDSTRASILRARWLPSLGIDLAAMLRPLDVFLLLALATALAATTWGRAAGSAAGGDAVTRPDDDVRVSLRAWDLAARFGLVAAATGAVITSDAGVRAQCVALAWVASAVELGATSTGPRRSAWGGEGLTGGIAVLAVTCLAALQATAAGHARFSPPVAADAAARAASPSEFVGLAMVLAASLAAALLMGVFPLRRWARIEGEVVDPRGELLRDVAGWAMGIAVLRAGFEAAPGSAAAAVDGLLWSTAGSLLLVALAFVGCRDVTSRRRVFTGFASTLTFGLMALPSRASWSVVGLVVLTFTFAALALVMGSDAALSRASEASSAEEDLPVARTATLAAWLAAAILLLPFGPGLVAWMVLGRGLAAPPPVGVEPVAFDGNAVAATWIAVVIAAVACLTMLVAPPTDLEANEVARGDGRSGSGGAHHTASVIVSLRRALWGLVVLVVCVPIVSSRLLAAADADAASSFERWAHRRCQDDVAKTSGRAARSHLRRTASEVSRDEDRCGPAPENTKAVSPNSPVQSPGSVRTSAVGPFNSAARGLETLQLELAEEYGE